MEEKYSRKKFKQDVEEAVKTGVEKHVKPKKPKKPRKKRVARPKPNYDDLKVKELYRRVKEKRDAVIAKAGFPPNLPRSRSKLVDLCKRVL